jgi:proliferating cell nuclear antigen PCNA
MYHKEKMKIVISDKVKKDLFVAIFQTLKNCTNIISINFEVERMYIQGMDKSHVCLFDVILLSGWFHEYDVDQTVVISFDSNTFFTIINSKQESNDIIIKHNKNDKDDEDNLFVELVSQEHSKGEFNKFFKIPLIDYDYDLMGIPSTEYDAEFSIHSKKICEIVSQMMIFGADIQINCSEEKIDLVTNGVTGEMRVNIPIQDLTQYSIVEGEEIQLSYSLSYIHKMCLTNKLSSEIDFFISGESPMKLKYDLGNDSSMEFYIAPKVIDTD